MDIRGGNTRAQESLKQSMKKLVAGYHGYAQQTSLVNSWLRMVRWRARHTGLARLGYRLGTVLLYWPEVIALLPTKQGLIDCGKNRLLTSSGV